MDNLNSRAKKVRVSLDKTQEEIADMAGIKMHNVQHFESQGKKKAKYIWPKYIEYLHNHHDINPVWLVLGIEKMSYNESRRDWALANMENYDNTKEGVKPGHSRAEKDTEPANDDRTKDSGGSISGADTPEQLREKIVELSRLTEGFGADAHKRLSNLETWMLTTKNIFESLEGLLGQIKKAGEE